MMNTVLSKFLSPIFFICIFVQLISLSCFSLEINSCQYIFRSIDSLKTANIPALNLARVVRAFAIDEFDRVFYFGSADDGLIMGYSPISKYILLFQNMFGTITPHSEFSLPQIEKLPTSFFGRLFRGKTESKINVRSIQYLNGYFKPEVSVIFESQTASDTKVYTAAYDLLDKKWGVVSELQNMNDSAELVLLQTFTVNQDEDLQSLAPQVKQKSFSNTVFKPANLISIYYDRKRSLIVATRGSGVAIAPRLMADDVFSSQVIYSAQLSYSGNIEMMYNQKQLVGFDKEKQKIIFFENLF